MTDSWVIEGVYGWLAQEIVGRATTLIWIDLPVEDCLANIQARGPQLGEALEDFHALLTWVGEYHARTSSSSFAAHEQLYLRYHGSKFRLDSRDAVSRMGDGRN